MYGDHHDPSYAAAADYYAVLQCDASSSTSSSDIKSAYYRLALLYHPDKQQHDRRPPLFSSPAGDAATSGSASGSRSEATVAYEQSTVNPDCSGVVAPSSTVHRGGACADAGLTLSFELISQAYQVLSNEELRRDYDERRAVRVYAGVNAEDVSINEFVRDDDSCDDSCYHRQCRCGDMYEVSQATVVAHIIPHHHHNYASASGVKNPLIDDAYRRCLYCHACFIPSPLSLSLSLFFFSLPLSLSIYLSISLCVCAVT